MNDLDEKKKEQISMCDLVFLEIEACNKKSFVRLILGFIASIAVTIFAWC